MKRSRLKNKADETKKPIDISSFKEERNVDIDNKIGGILVCIKSSIPSRCLSYNKLCISIQAIPLRLT